MPAISYKIHQENLQPFPKVKINLQGLAIGDGLCDPETVSLIKILQCRLHYTCFLLNSGLLQAFSQVFYHTDNYIHVYNMIIQHFDSGRA